MTININKQLDKPAISIKQTIFLFSAIIPIVSFVCFQIYRLNSISEKTDSIEKTNNEISNSISKMITDIEVIKTECANIKEDLKDINKKIK